MNIKVVTLQENGANVEYVEYLTWEDSETGKKYALFLLKDFLSEFMDALMDLEQVLRVLRLYEVKNDSYMLVEDENLKKVAYTEAIRVGRT